MTQQQDSSPDLSLKLRRGSSDSRDSFYMDFDRGIDSDIEEMATTSGADFGGDTTGEISALGMKAEGVRWENQNHSENPIFQSDAES